MTGRNVIQVHYVVLLVDNILQSVIWNLNACLTRMPAQICGGLGGGMYHKTGIERYRLWVTEQGWESVRVLPLNSHG